MANFAAFGGDLSNPIGGFKTDQIQNLDELSVVAPRLNKPQAQA